MKPSPAQLGVVTDVRQNVATPEGQQASVMVQHTKTPYSLILLAIHSPPLGSYAHGHAAHMMYVHIRHDRHFMHGRWCAARIVPEYPWRMRHEEK